MVLLPPGRYRYCDTERMITKSELSKDNPIVIGGFTVYFEEAPEPASSAEVSSLHFRCVISNFDGESEGKAKQDNTAKFDSW